MPHVTPGPWHVGKGGGCVVSEVPTDPKRQDSDDLGYYGGYLIAESISAGNAEVLADAITYAEVFGSPAFRGLDLIREAATDAWGYRLQLQVDGRVLALIDFSPIVVLRRGADILQAEARQQHGIVLAMAQFAPRLTPAVPQ